MRVDSKPWYPDLLSKNIKNAAKEILGSCASLGVTVDGKEPKIVQQEITKGLYDEVFNKWNGILEG